MQELVKLDCKYDFFKKNRCYNFIFVASSYRACVYICLDFQTTNLSFLTYQARNGNISFINYQKKSERTEGLGKFQLLKIQRLIKNVRLLVNF